jgi:hypothetical protein
MCREHSRYGTTGQFLTTERHLSLLPVQSAQMGNIATRAWREYAPRNPGIQGEISSGISSVSRSRSALSLVETR